MAFISADIKIPQTANSVPVQLYFPTDLPDTVGNEVRGVITLLHGLGNTPADWMQMSAVARYAADNGYALVAPYAANSFYTDMRQGPPWYTILTELLPAQLQRIFKLPTGRECNFIAGLSMGGYGAMRIGLSHPQRYAAIGSFSGALDMRLSLDDARKGSMYRPFLTPAFGEDCLLPDDGDVIKLAQRVAALPKAQQPRLFCCCGLQDDDEMRILSQNRSFCKAVEPLGLDARFVERDGVHEWNFWDRCLADFIGFIQNSDYGLRKQKDWS